MNNKSEMKVVAVVGVERESCCVENEMRWGEERVFGYFWNFLLFRVSYKSTQPLLPLPPPTIPSHSFMLQITGTSNHFKYSPFSFSLLDTYVCMMSRLYLYYVNAISNCFSSWAVNKVNESLLKRQKKRDEEIRENGY